MDVDDGEFQRNHNLSRLLQAVYGSQHEGPYFHRLICVPCHPGPWSLASPKFIPLSTSSIDIDGHSTTRLVLQEGLSNGVNEAHLKESSIVNRASEV